MYKLKLQLRDTTREFASKAACDNAYKRVLNDLLALGIPERNIVLYKIETEYSDFLKREVEKVTESNVD